MKKALALILALTLVMAMAVPTYAAVTSPKAPVTDTSATSPVPELVPDQTADPNLVIDLVPVEDAEDLSEEAQEAYVAAQESLEEAAPEGMKTQYFFYFTAYVKDGNETTKVSGPISITLKIENASKVVVKQFIDGKWVELEVVVNPDGTVTIKNAVEGPMAIFTK